MKDRRLTTILGYIGANVRRLRDAKEWSQARLAEAADLDVRYVQRIERGKVNLSTAVLVALATALNVKPGVLFRPAKLRPRVWGRPRRSLTR